MKKIKKKRSKISNFLIIGALALGLFFVLKDSNLINELFYTRDSQNNNALPGFTPRPTPLTDSTSSTISGQASPRSTVSPPTTPTPVPRPSPKPTVLFNVPFTPQAPFGDWGDPRQQDGCEESSAIMAMHWVDNKSLTLEKAEQGITTISDFELEKYGGYHDTSARDTIERIFKDYFNYNNVALKSGIDGNDIKRELQKGNLVLVPVNGQLLNNPFYNPPGPLQHMLVIKGYDDNTKEFITNDPGTKRGDSFRYSENLLESALQDYPTGYKEPITQINKVMIIVRPRS